MTLVVRLINGTEDRFAPYNGCVRCGATETRDVSRRNTSWSHDWNSECANCGYHRNIDNDEFYRPESLWNCSAEPDGSGALIVKQYVAQVAYYPAGAWLSWRTE